MIIQLRGTSGSGKSTAVRAIMDRYGPRSPVRKVGMKRRQPIGYLCAPQEPDGPSLFVAGHYETACGGCDTLPTYDFIIDLVREAATSGYDVLFEGLLISGEVTRCASLQDFLYLSIGLDVPVEVCLDSVNQRRRKKKPEALDVNPKNTIAKATTVRGAMSRLAELGVRTEWQTRETVVDRVVGLLALGS